MPARVRSRRPLDLVRTHARGYRPTRRPLLVNLGNAQYPAVTGKGRPGGREFPEDLRARYGTAYALKFLERPRGHDFRVPMLEGIYPPAEGSRRPRPAHRPMRCRLLVRVPEGIGRNDVAEARRRRRARRGKEPASVRRGTAREGRCIQMLHVGAYDTEPRTIAQMQAAAPAEGLRLVGPHREIYFSDPHRVPAARLHTVIRIPVRPATPRRRRWAAGRSERGDPARPPRAFG